MIGTMEADFHALLRDLKDKGERLDQTLALLAQREERLARGERDLAGRAAQADQILKGAKEKGYLEAQEVIRKARREVAAIIEEARRDKAREAREARGLLDQAEVEIEQVLAELNPVEELAPDKITVGKTLFVKPLNCDAKILSVDSRTGRVRVRAGSMELEVAIATLSKARGKELKVQQKRAQEAERAEPVSSINLLGMRVEEALGELEPFLNHAALDRIPELRVVHGKGTGALMKGVRNYLDSHPLVASFRTGERFEGGDGVTVVTLR
jgi:DNA mismatch repair protein MutS2